MKARAKAGATGETPRRKAGTVGEAPREKGDTVGEALRARDGAVDEARVSKGVTVDGTPRAKGSTVDKALRVKGGTVDKALRVKGSTDDKALLVKGATDDKSLRVKGGTVDEALRNEDGAAHEASRGKDRTVSKALKRYRLDDDRKVELSLFDPAADVLDVADEAIAGALKDLQTEIATLQNRLFAERKRSLLVVLQGMDTSGKDGTTIAVFGATHPQGVVVTPFKAPSADEAAHDFLWRVHPHAPAAGMIAVFNRSHYEAVIAERVLGLADAAECKRRAAQIVAFERMLVAHGTTIVKCFLHISKGEQKERLQSRLDDPTKHWKFNANDLVERKRWDANRAAYEDALRRTATKDAPWWIVPADAKKRRNVMAATIVRNALARMDPTYPPLPPEDRALVVD